MKVTVDNPRYPHHVRIIRKVEEDWLPDEGSTGSSSGVGGDLIIYEGPGRSYTETTTTGDAKVDTNKRKASIPMRYDDWVQQNRLSDEGPMVPMSGDILYVTKGCITEEWEVKDFEPDNDRSVVYGELSRNFNIE